METDKRRILTDALLEQLPIGVILSDNMGRIVYVNQTAEQIRHVKREDLLGHNVIDCHRSETQHNVQRAIDNIVQKPDTHYKRMVEDVARNKYYQNTYAGVVDDFHNTIGLAVLTEDVTEKRRLELERASAYQKMQETSDSIRNKYHDLLVSSLESIATMLEVRDPYTRDHSRNVCDCALKMYEHRFGIGQDYLTLRTAATLHDIGKIGISDAILHKQGRLTEQEYETVKQHCAYAEQILKPLDAGSCISTIVRHHHERYDGTGYPDGLQKDQIPMLSRIIAVADAFDAMHSTRPYRAAMPYEQCVEEIAACKGSQFDPEWVEVFGDLAKTGSL